MRFFKYFAIAGIVLAVLIGLYIAHAIFSTQPNLEKEQIIYIWDDAHIDDVYVLLKERGVKVEKPLFIFLSKQLSYTDNIKPGRYEIKVGSSLITILRHLRSGNQDPVEVTIHNENSAEKLAQKLARYLLYDSIDYVKVFTNDSILHEYNIDSITFLSYIIPNTYFMYYNLKPIKVLERFIYEYDQFWSKEGRNKRANALGMSFDEVYTLASIIERESQYRPERARIAGVYLNRLKKGIPLQADPTVLFALNKPEARRVLKKYLEVDSPYNTYLYPGLPPGPIGTASISSIDAVLNYETHEYLYFCARPDNSGQHVFAKTYAMHLQNAKMFQNWLNKREVYR